MLESYLISTKKYPKTELISIFRLYRPTSPPPKLMAAILPQNCFLWRERERELAFKYNPLVKIRKIQKVL
jgi:hypothetical protein